MKLFVMVELLSSLAVGVLCWHFGLAWAQIVIVVLVSFALPPVIVWLGDHLRFRFEWR